MLRILTVLFFLGSLGAGLWAQTDTGLASWYSDDLAGRPTASGEPYDPLAYTAAHRTLRFGIRLWVTNPANGRSVTVRVNDRGPLVEDRVLDLSRAAAEALGLTEAGVAAVEIRVLRAGEDGAAGPEVRIDTWFQIGAYRTETNARTQARALADAGFKPKLRQDGSLYRVYLEASEPSAGALAARLTAGGWKSFLQVNREPRGEPVQLSTD